MLEILKIIILTCQLSGSSPSFVDKLQKECQKKLVECVTPSGFTSIEQERRLLKCLKER